MAPNWNYGYDGISRPPTSRGRVDEAYLKVTKAVGAI
jgi:hypothetical protein